MSIRKGFKFSQPHFWDGQSRQQRFGAALDPKTVKIDDRSLKDLLIFAGKYARELLYYNTATNAADGDWQPFFELPPDAVLEALDFSKSTEDVLTSLQLKGGTEPHLALFLTFLRLYRHAQNQLNHLTRKHLDFYYRQVLGFSPLPAVPDRAHLIFELKKNVREQRILSGTLFTAGKDQTGKTLHYRLDRELVVYPAKIGSLHSVFVDADQNDTVHVAPKADSADGLGAPLDKNEPKWPPFGHNQLPKGEMGFALSSPVLRLKKGSRAVTVDLKLAGLPTGSDLASRAQDVFDTSGPCMLWTTSTPWMMLCGPNCFS